MNSVLHGKTIIWDGDSICAGSTETGNWATRIAANNAMTCRNYAVGGGTVADCFPLLASGHKRHSLSATIDRMYAEYPSADYVIFEGGTNDADLFKDHFDTLGERMGTLNPDDYSGNYDEGTFIGSLETVFYKAAKYWYGKKIGFIIAQKMGQSAGSLNRRREYFDRCAEVCKKWGIPCLDLWHGCYLNPTLPWMYNRELTPEENRNNNEGFYIDGQHLTARGYDFTAEIVERWLLTL